MTSYVATFVPRKQQQWAPTVTCELPFGLLVLIRKSLVRAQSNPGSHGTYEHVSTRLFAGKADMVFSGERGGGGLCMTALMGEPVKEDFAPTESSDSKSHGSMCRTVPQPSCWVPGSAPTVRPSSEALPQRVPVSGHSTYLD